MLFLKWEKIHFCTKKMSKTMKSAIFELKKKTGFLTEIILFSTFQVKVRPPKTTRRRPPRLPNSEVPPSTLILILNVKKPMIKNFKVVKVVLASQIFYPPNNNYTKFMKKISVYVRRLAKIRPDFQPRNLQHEISTLKMKELL